MSKTRSAAKSPAQKQKTPFFRDDRKVGWLFAGFAFLLYIQSTGFDYALDDLAVIRSNDFVHDGFKGFGKILSTFYWHGNATFAESNSGLFRPLSLLLFAIEWKIAPDSPGFYHFVNVLLYALSAYLVYRMLRELFRDYSVTLPALATLLWIAHPTHTEVAANIKSADEILSVIFFCLAMLQLLKWTDNGRMKPVLLSGVFFFLALLSKEGAVLFLPVALLALYLFRNKQVKQLLKPSAVLAGVTLVWLAWHTAVIAAGPERREYTYLDNSLFATDDPVTRIATAIGMQGDYLVKAFTGFPLSWDYSYNQVPLKTFGDVGVLLSLLVCGGLLVFAFMRIKKDPVLSFGILVYFITFALTSNVFVQIGATMADRFLFVPTLGFAIAVTWLVLKLTKGVQEKQLHQNAVYVLAPVLLFYSIRSFSRSQDWAYESTLFSADVETVPNSGRANSNCGVSPLNNALALPEGMERQNLLSQAYGYFHKAVDIDPNDVGSLRSLGQIEYHRKNYTVSAAWFRRCIETYKKISVERMDTLFVDPAVYVDFGDALMLAKRYDSAAVAFREAIAITPENGDAHIKLGGAYLSLKDTAAAIVNYRKATEINPDDIKAWDKLANVLGQNRQYEKSSEAFLQLARLMPGDPKPYQMLYTNCLYSGDSVNGQKYYETYRKLGGK